ncbi:MAG TPA: CpsD/CapB family tyrosine-protein kinase [Candidatus Brocadiia bacterium]|nr:CpsD/CapB family tyrosine-protein kinase [Planctomycetota bacterium]MBI4007856.1 CpsD/CapB family tyrosine-protein kinase [Planctomycetota bacterium]MDO8092514.1 CpsD/CapB family tyrosine-protein kinase [Candidatus Brocadiales bacterium]
MSNIEKALEKAAKEHKRFDGETVEPVLPYVAESFDENKVDEHIVSYYDSIGRQTWTRTVPVMESFRRLRLKIRNVFETNSYKTFAFVSASQGEGKSTTTLNVAITLTQDINCRVVVLDADLRRPAIHRFLGLRPRKGLANLLNNETDVGSVVMETFIPRLSILPAGDKPRNTCELLTSKKMGEIVATLKSQFDFVIIDTPPVLAFSETVPVCRLADGVIFVIEANHTKKRPVKRSLELLQDCNVLGFVLNKEEIASSDYYGHIYKTNY